MQNTINNVLFQLYSGDFLNIKSVITIILVIGAIGFAYLFFFSPLTPPSTLSYEEGDKTNSTLFASNLQLSSSLFIVTDLRGSTQNQRSNIMQCGIDFAGSAGVAGKNITVYSIEGSECISSEGKYTVNQCIEKSKSGISIFIKSGLNSVFYKNKIVVGISEKYSPKECNIISTNNS